MPKKRKDIDREIAKVRAAEQSAAGAARREAAEKRKLLEKFSRIALQALQASDERSFAEALRLANVLEGSPEWKAAWEFYRAHHG